MRAAMVNAAAGLVLGAAAPPAAAQTITLEPSAAMRCLAPAAEQRGMPEYPFDAWKREHKGRVLVELSFTATDKGPAVKVLTSFGDGDSEDRFVDAVRQHVAAYRVPCLDESAGGPAQLQLEFVFLPDTREVRSSGPQDPGAARRSELLKCVRHTSGNKAPDYPESALQLNLQGRLLARLHFNAKDQAPQVKVLARPAARPLVSAISTFAAGYRMPCFDGGEPIDATYTYVFVIEGNGAFGLKPLGLLDLMANVRGIRQQALKFDTTTMGCPFNVRLQYRQPHMLNSLSEVDDRNPARQPLLNWLANAHLELPDKSLDAAFADHTVITVPCAKINLKPQETP